MNFLRVFPLEMDRRTFWLDDEVERRGSAEAAGSEERKEQ